MSSLSQPENLQPADSPFTFHPSLACDPDLAPQFLLSDFAARDRVMAHKHARNGVIATLAASFPAHDPVTDVELGPGAPGMGTLAATVRDAMDAGAGEVEGEGDSVVEEMETQSWMPSRRFKVGAAGVNAGASVVARGKGWNVGDCVPADAKSNVRAIGRRP